MLNQLLGLGNFQSLRHPPQLGTEEYPYFITFRPQQVQYGKSRNISQNSRVAANEVLNSGKVSGPFGQVKDQIGGVIDTLSKGAQDSIDEIGGFFKSGSLESAAKKFGKIVKGKIRIGDFILSSGLITDPDRLFDTGSISLYLPEGLAAQYGIDYDTQTLGAVVEQATKTSGADFMKSEEGTQLAKAFGADVLREAGKASAVTAMTQGQVANPFSYAIFSGMQHRNFKYDFNLVAQTSAESKEIKSICDQFIYWSLPGRDVNDNTFLEIPCQWKIEYRVLDKNLDMFEQPRACFLNDISIEYNSETGNTVHADGAPTSVKLSLSFTEIEPVYRDRMKPFLSGGDKK